MKTKCVYHFKPLMMTGNVLYPLNNLKTSHPEIYAQAARKYEGREQLLKETIPPLECLWNDVIHLSPIHPQIIVDTWRKEGIYDHSKLASQRIEVYEIPVEMLHEESTVYFQSRIKEFGDFSRYDDEFRSFIKSTFNEQTEVEKTQIEV